MVQPLRKKIYGDGVDIVDTTLLLNIVILQEVSEACEDLSGADKRAQYHCCGSRTAHSATGPSYRTIFGEFSQSFQLIDGEDSRTSLRTSRPSDSAQLPRRQSSSWRSSKWHEASGTMKPEYAHFNYTLSFHISLNSLPVFSLNCSDIEVLEHLWKEFMCPPWVLSHSAHIKGQT